MEKAIRCQSIYAFLEDPLTNQDVEALDDLALSIMVLRRISDQTYKEIYPDVDEADACRRSADLLAGSLSVLKETLVDLRGKNPKLLLPDLIGEAKKRVDDLSIRSLSEAYNHFVSEFQKIGGCPGRVTNEE